MNDRPADAVSLLAQADLVLLLCDMLRRPDGPAGGPPQPQALARLLRAAGMDDADLADAFAAAIAELAAVPGDALVAEYHRLFDGPMACPPDETAYIRRDKGGLIADAAGFYRAFGFAPRQGAGDRPDNIVVELEFVAVLLVMAAQAARAGDAANLDTTRSALASFAASHLSEWINAFAATLVGAAGLRYYAAAAAAAQKLWAALCRVHGWAPPRPAFAPAGEDPSPPECGPDGAAAADLTVRGRSSAG